MMSKKSTVDLINALKTLKNMNLQQFKIIRNYLELNSKLTKEWFQCHNQILIKITNDINEFMKNILKQNAFEAYLRSSYEEREIPLQKFIELEKRAQQVLKDFQLSKNALSQEFFEFDYILDEIKDSLE
ncbi:MAG: hypothetical protein KAW51_07380 [Candidatus Lokiarchaeota archaeon]|nr:hypothetical protein [Candidatus Lokiarchaeota archaeon]